MQPPKAIKRAVKVLVNLLGMLLAVILIILVAATQHGETVSSPGLGQGGLGNTGLGGSQLGGGFGLGFGSRWGCRLDVGSSGVCVYAYILGAVSLLLSLIVVALALVACATGNDAPVILDFTIHVLHALWWLIGLAVLGTFVSRANDRGLAGRGPRVAIVFVALASFVMYLASLWTNACCCIARFKNENVSMYV